VALIRATISAGSRRRNGGSGIGSGMGPFRLLGRVLTWGRVEPRSCGYVPQTPQMDTFTLVFVLRTPSGFAGPVIETLRGQDEALRLWQDDADPSVLRGSIECDAVDLDAALAHGRELAGGLLARTASDLAVEEVAAMDDERQLVWRGTP
jgi:hypothetical protein